MSGEVTVPLLLIQVLAPAWLYTRLTKDAIAAGGGFWSQERMWLRFGRPSSAAGAGAGYQSVCSPLVLPLLLHCLQVSPVLTIWSTVLLSAGCLYVLWPSPLALPSDIYLPLISVDERASTTAFLVVALFSSTLNLLPPSAPLPFISRILYRQDQHLLL